MINAIADFLIDRIKIYLKNDAKSKEIDPAQLKELADYFHSAIVKLKRMPAEQTG